MVAGNVGTEQRYEYTVIGRPVNEAARLTEVAKGRPVRVLAGAGAVDRAGDEADHWAALGTMALRGQSVPTAVFEPVGVRELLGITIGVASIKEKSLCKNTPTLAFLFLTLCVRIFSKIHCVC